MSIELVRILVLTCRVKCAVRLASGAAFVTTGKVIVLIPIADKSPPLTTGTAGKTG